LLLELCLWRKKSVRVSWRKYYWGTLGLILLEKLLGGRSWTGSKLNQEVVGWERGMEGSGRDWKSGEKESFSSSFILGVPGFCSSVTLNLNCLYVSGQTGSHFPFTNTLAPS